MKEARLASLYTLSKAQGGTSSLHLLELGHQKSWLAGCLLETRWVIQRNNVGSRGDVTEDENGL